MTIYCLGHSLDGKPNGCPAANQCEAHVAIRFQIIDGSTVSERICGEFPAPIEPIHCGFECGK